MSESFQRKNLSATNFVRAQAGLQKGLSEEQAGKPVNSYACMCKDGVWEEIQALQGSEQCIFLRASSMGREAF